MRIPQPVHNWGQAPLNLLVIQKSRVCALVHCTGSLYTQLFTFSSTPAIFTATAQLNKRHKHSCRDTEKDLATTEGN